MLRFCTLFSGSEGNCTYIGYADTHILVDAGKSARAIEQGLNGIGVCPGDISALLVTHEHGDHASAIDVFACRHNTKVYASHGTWSGLEGRFVNKLPLSNRFRVDSDADFFVGQMNVLPFKLHHDTIEPTGYKVYAGGKKAVIVTDLGHTDKDIINTVSDADIMVLESNFDGDMLMHGSYPAMLKRRILGNRGHLSNDECADMLAKMSFERPKYVMLGHLSKNNNTPELAFKTASKKLMELGLNIGRDVYLTVAPRNAASGVISVR